MGIRDLIERAIKILALKEKIEEKKEENTPEIVWNIPYIPNYHKIYQLRKDIWNKKLARSYPIPISIEYGGYGGGEETVEEGREIKEEKEENKELVPLQDLMKEREEEGYEHEEIKQLYKNIRYESINIKYPLIMTKFDNKTLTLAYAEIKFDPSISRLKYFVHEPIVNEKQRKLIQNTIKYLIEKLDIDFYSIKNIQAAYEYINEKIDEIWKFFGVKLDNLTELKIKYYIFRDTVGLNKIEPLMHDPFIEDISCDGVGIPVYIFHRNPILGELETNIIFETEEELNTFVMKLAQRCGRPLSVSQPLLDGALPDGSRVQITYGKDIARRGSNFTIRKFTKEPLTPTDLINFGTADPFIFAYLWSAIESGMSILISGGTATGKTTLLNAISLFIKPELKIISIEDTPELQLPHPNWVPLVARPGFGPTSYGAVEMFDLLKASLRQRPDYIIVGEVRGREAYVLFQGIATGHPALGTIHADSIRAVIDRLTSPPINLPKVLLENLDMIVFLTRLKVGGSYVRRVKEITEIVGYNPDTKDIDYITSFRWRPKDDKFIAFRSRVLNKVKELKGYTEEQMLQDLKFKTQILNWMVKKNIRHYLEFSRIISMYYTSPTKLAEMISNDFI